MVEKILTDLSEKKNEESMHKIEYQINSPTLIAPSFVANHPDPGCESLSAANQNRTENSSLQDILIKKDYSKPGRLLGLDVSDKYVSLAVSDWKNLTAVPLRALDKQENNLSSMAAVLFQSLIHEHNLVGFVVGTNYGLSDSRPLVGLYVTIFQDYHLLSLRPQA
ncbi:hypothetical protein Ddye_012673 [Dipteronia dyeriana]|uniref:YqgF/RNase H-like domain-containing protein n=1 Tax=Dipteronia dyeriana TaxID=168575 RepID=A0AAD9X4W6_9ROSI|nr:hypothetical protein Ddye_012673 [Dipteronia dyeriana]